MNIARIQFLGEELPDGALAFATIRDGVLVFVWDRSKVVEVLETQGLDAVLGAANALVNDTIGSNEPRPVQLRVIS